MSCYMKHITCLYLTCSENWDVDQEKLKQQQICFLWSIKKQTKRGKIRNQNIIEDQKVETL